ncbi:uncharacterized protein BX663DRAFT_12969 [Cokeromyces recurvatus]|uniref:uncharacterized protein n=1 Tax=Cokeromyces recurvatus TaxID=90255 RepID=UPI00222033A9|nr:uncharacterized protein BX663DRAFT_12969 [Cokeromyces recurvatus]KAI7907856.1 hypothetical protein BX663DRAFT_12969 [Cokeromyces recurvatus]
MIKWVTKYLRRIKTNFTIHEISGSLGDLGTLLPIMMSLAISGQINLTSTLWFTGIWNILSGICFGVPVCVQPMKAIAAVVLTKNMPIQENMAAGISVGALVFFLGITRTIHLIGTFTPTPVIKGIQLGTAIQLIKKAQSLVSDLKWTIDSTNWSDNNTWILLAFIFVVFCYQTKVPSALILFLIGFIFALIMMFATSNDYERPSVGHGHYPDTIIVPTADQFRSGFLNAGLGQLPLTSLNSVIALSALIIDLFPNKRPSTSSIAMSVGVMNLVGCWFGAMPVCHGSGGLAGQYRFGARSEVSVIILGSLKWILGILFGSSLVGLLQVFPTSILAVLLFISGVELGSTARTLNDGIEDVEKQRENFTIMLLTAGALVSYSNDGIGFCAGLVSAILLAMQRLGIKEWSKLARENICSVPHVWRNQHLESPITLPIITEERTNILTSSSIDNNYGTQQQKNADILKEDVPTSTIKK